MLRRRRPFAAAALLAAGLAPAAPAEACAPPGFAAIAGRLAGFGADGDLRLAEGGLFRLLGARVASGDAARASEMARQGGFSLWTDSQAAPDRWGRRPAVARGSRDSAADLAQILLESGLAVATPQDLPQDCRVPLLQAESRARAARLGLWARSEDGLLDAAAGPAVAGRAGRFAVMEGRIVSVGQTRRAAYLNFGARGLAASAEMPLPVWREIERRGWTRENLRGQKVRARGLVQEASPARMLVEAAASIEIGD